jgi:hypothetical protein
MMGLKMDFTVEVKKWVKGVEKIWETVGNAKMIIYSWYRIQLLLSKQNDRTIAKLSVTYEKPNGLFARIISFLVADWYCNWCLKNMLRDTKRILESNNNLKTFFMKLTASKFGLAIGLAFAIGFLLCNLIFLIAGENFSLSIMNMIFHKTDFKSIMVSDGFNFGKLSGGIAVLFIAGTFMGWFTAIIYNSLNKAKVS